MLLRTSWWPRWLLFAAVLMLVSFSWERPASAQVNVSVTVSSAYFHQRLAPYGTWIRHTRWGEVWHPRAGADFRPYLNGHWSYTSDYGVIFISTTIWGDIVYHYGRWVYDPQYGWIWIPGYVWAPAWVVWRVGGGYVAWLPMPPCSNYYGSYLGPGLYTGGIYPDTDYGYQCYQDWYGSSISTTVFLSYWTVLPETHLFAPALSRWRLHHREYGAILPRTRNITDYRTLNNRVVNRSFSRSGLDAMLRKRIAPVPSRDAIRKGSVITSVTAGERLERQSGPRMVPGGVPLRRTTPSSRPSVRSQPSGTHSTTRKPLPTSPRQTVPQSQREQAPSTSSQRPTTRTPYNAPSSAPRRAAPQSERMPAVPRTAPRRPSDAQRKPQTGSAGPAHDGRRGQPDDDGRKQ